MALQAWRLCRELLVFLHCSHACCTFMRHQTSSVMPRLFMHFFLLMRAACCFDEIAAFLKLCMVLLLSCSVVIPETLCICIAFLYVAYTRRLTNQTNQKDLSIFIE